MIILKQVIDSDRQGHVIGSHPDAQWGQGGRIALTVGGREMCAQTRRSPDGEVVCDRALLGHARPTGKPLAFPTIRGFMVATLWGEAAFSTCQAGRTYLTVHQIEGDKVTQILGAPLKVSTPAPSPLFREGRLFVFGGSGEVEEIAVE